MDFMIKLSHCIDCCLLTLILEKPTRCRKFPWTILEMDEWNWKHTVINEATSECSPLFLSNYVKRQIYEYFFNCVIMNIMFLRGRKGIIQKTSTMYSVVTRKFSDVWKPGKNICIDEGMIPFRGKVHFKVYNTDKPDKYCYHRLYVT